MGKRKEYTKDELKGFLTILKEITGVKYDTRNISSKDGCMIAMDKILVKYTHRRITEVYDLLISENNYLRNRIAELKNKKWWQFWK